MTRDPRPLPATSNERGIALVAAVLVVLLSSVMVVTFMSTTVGERAVSSNVQTAKTSLYAADAGVRAQQQLLANYAGTQLANRITAWTNAGATGPVIPQPDSLFNGGPMTTTSTNPAFSTTSSIRWLDSSIQPQTQVYNYLYTIQSTGTVNTTGRRNVQAQGILRVSATRGSFTNYLMFTNTHTNAAGSAIWFSSSVSFDGHVHTNTKLRFAYQPTFQDLVTSHSATAEYYNNGGTVKDLNANNNGTIDVPNFYGGFDRNKPTVPLPTNAYDQQSAALGLSSTGSAPTNAQINTAIGASGSGTPANGIYIPNSGGAITGGLYVQGSLDQCKIWADTTTGIQYYRLAMGSTNKTIAVNAATNQTSVQIGTGTPTVYSGTPRGILYVNGAVTDLRGPDRVSGSPPPALGTGTKLLVTAKNDIVIQRDITMHDYDAATNVLGIYSTSGSVRVGTSAPNDCKLDAYVMATGSSGEFKVDSYDSGSPRGTFRLRGGMVASYYGAFFTFYSNGTLKTGYARQFNYDRRGLVPPYFPTTTQFNANIPSARTLAWKEI